MSGFFFKVKLDRSNLQYLYLSLGRCCIVWYTWRRTACRHATKFQIVRCASEGRSHAASCKSRKNKVYVLKWPSYLYLYFCNEISTSINSKYNTIVLLLVFIPHLSSSLHQYNPSTSLSLSRSSYYFCDTKGWRWGV